MISPLGSSERKANFYFLHLVDLNSKVWHTLWFTYQLVCDYHVSNGNVTYKTRMIMNYYFKWMRHIISFLYTCFRMSCKIWNETSKNRKWLSTRQVKVSNFTIMGKSNNRGGGIGEVRMHQRRWKKISLRITVLDLVKRWIWLRL